MATAGAALAEIYVKKKLHKEKTKGMENKGSKEKSLTYNQGKSDSVLRFDRVNCQFWYCKVYVMKKLNKEKKMLKSLGNKEANKEVPSFGCSFFRAFHRVHLCSRCSPIVQFAHWKLDKHKTLAQAKITPVH
ncbi:Uncharacterized protein Adt_19404 [Abeliophyllum distichum]|uniref:Uncharacterized protein n=1 Tax=Abeliophyllum distichum TaxID=126358 RepID=A0ABD1SVA9_9LAMI